MRRTEGFSLVELLVVILIIGILAAIALPAFLRHKMDAADARAKVTARSGATALEVYNGEHGDYLATKAELLEISPDLAAATWSVDSTAKTYILTVTSSYGHDFVFERTASGNVIRTCTTGTDPVGAGGCAADGTW